MPARIPSCPKCSASMKEGFELDETYGAYLPTYWVEGRPEKSIWTGVKLRHKTRLQVATWRCSFCGYLEHYAN